MLINLEKMLTTLKHTKPLVLCLTNYVTMDFMANSLLALGAAPLMSEEVREIEELVTLSHAINLNIGTLQESFLVRARKAAFYANTLRKPLVLDPVGAGASYLRTQAALEFLPFATILRGNASEIMALYDATSPTKGVESLHQPKEAEKAAGYLAHHRVVAATGIQDLIVDKERKIVLPYGSAVMPYVTGMGCVLTAIIAAFHAICADPFEATVGAVTYVGLCGQQAEEKSSFPGSFRTHFIDALYAPSWKRMREWYREQKSVKAEGTL